VALDIIAWIIIAVAFIASFAGIVYPVIPSPLMLWIGFLVFQFMLSDGDLSVFFWVAMVILTVILIISDIIANSYLLKNSAEVNGASESQQSVSLLVPLLSRLLESLSCRSLLCLRQSLFKEEH
jgi:uncharacterized protein YqgC (DUF456 family)